MKNRIHLKKRKNTFKLKKQNNYKISKKDKILLITLFIIISVIFCINLIGKKITPILMTYAEKKAKSIATIMITEAVNNNVFKDMSKDDLFIETKDSDGNIVSTDFNPVVVNTVLNKITIYVQNYLEQLESGGIDELELSSTILSSYDLDTLNELEAEDIAMGILDYKNGCANFLCKGESIQTNGVRK